MKEAEEDLWIVPADVRVITVNQYVNARGELVMGRGAAAEASQRFPCFASEMGRDILSWRKGGNTEFPLQHHVRYGLITYPVKGAYHTIPGLWPPHEGWRCGHHIRSPWCRVEVLSHILHHLPRLVQIVDQAGWKAVALPRIGCGYGGLNWEHTVKPILSAVLDDRFLVCSLPSKEPRR